MVSDAGPLGALAALRDLLRPGPIVGLGLHQPVRHGTCPPVLPLASNVDAQRSRSPHEEDRTSALERNTDGRRARVAGVAPRDHADVRTPGSPGWPALVMG